jgi:hypothetical protein
LRARATLDNNFAKARQRLLKSRACRPKSTERRHRQNEVHEHAGTERDKQKNRETTQFAISHGFGLKLAENDGWHKRFSIGQTQAATFRSREGLLECLQVADFVSPSKFAGLEAAWE